jgi:hydroxypyruvate reductase
MGRNRCGNLDDNRIIGNNRRATESALNQARQEGFHTLLLTNLLQGEARQVGRVIASIARQSALMGEPLPRPACIVLGGETTVTLTGLGKGGRNQELALGCVEELAGLERTIIVSLATDGGDGPTDAAGAVVTGETYASAYALGLHPSKFLKENDSYNYFRRLSDLIKTGPTQTNVNDLVFVFTY